MKFLKVLAFSLASLASLASLSTHAEQVSYGYTASLYEVSPELAQYFKGAETVSGTITVNTDAVREDLGFGILYNGDAFSTEMTVGNAQFTAKNGSLLSNVNLPGYAIFNHFTAKPEFPEVRITNFINAGSYSLASWSFITNGGFYGESPGQVLSTPYDSAMVSLDYYLPSGDQIDVEWKLGNVQQLPAVTAVPEPSNYVIFLAGLGFAGFLAHRKWQA